MRRRSRSLLITGCVLLTAFVLLTILVKFVDVKAIGPQHSEVGFAALNGWWHELVGYKKGWHVITDILGYLSILVAFFFAVVGALQLIRGRSLRAVDPDILCLGGLYAAAILFYLFFEICVINYRPLILDEGLEASYPSSHTMVAIVIFLSASWEAARRLRGEIGRILRYVFIFLTVITVFGRLLSGVHWFTDILGGTLLGVGLFCLFTEAVRRLRKRRR